MSKTSSFAKLKNIFNLSTSPLRPLPGFIIIGAQKSGTTFLYELLSSHPKVKVDLAVSKEVHFFDSPQWSKGVLWYRSHFPLLLGAAMTGEDCPYYCIHPHTPRRMAQVIPDAKVILLLRNPVERAYSHYQMQFRKGYEKLATFEEAIEAEPGRLNGEIEKMLADENYRSNAHKQFTYLLRGRYIDQVEAYREYFDKSQILVLKSEEMFSNPAAGYAKALRFLNLPEWKPASFAPVNVGKYSDMKPETRQRLEEYFAPYNQRLYAYLGEDFSW